MRFGGIVFWFFVVEIFAVMCAQIGFYEEASRGGSGRESVYELDEGGVVSNRAIKRVAGG